MVALKSYWCVLCYLFKFLLGGIMFIEAVWTFLQTYVSHSFLYNLKKFIKMNLLQEYEHVFLYFF